MRGPTPKDVLAHVTLVTGKEEFLSERTVVGRPRGRTPPRPRGRGLRDPGVRADPGRSSASWRRRRCSPRPGASSCAAWRTCPRSRSTACSTYAAAPGRRRRAGAGARRRPEGLGRARPSCASSPGVTEVKSEELRASEYPGFVTAEARAARAARSSPRRPRRWCRPSARTCARSSAAADQLANDFPGETLTEEKVKRYFGGRAEAKSFAVADAAFWGRRRPALEELRWALDGGTAPVLVTSAFAGSARGIARYLSAPRGMREVDLAREVGVPPWKVRTIRDQSRGWSDSRHRPRDPHRRPGRRRHQGRAPATRRTRWSGWC